MPRLSKKIKKEMAFFINPGTGKRQYNRQCRACIHDCKQSYRATIIACPGIIPYPEGWAQRPHRAKNSGRGETTLLLVFSAHTSDIFAETGTHRGCI